MGQQTVDGTTRDAAIAAWKDLAADHAEKAQKWKRAHDLRDVRLDDLVKAHDNDIGPDQRAKVSAQTAKAVAKEKKLLTEKQEAKKAVDSAWETVQQFEEDADITPLIPDPEPADATATDGARFVRKDPNSVAVERAPPTARDIDVAAMRSASEARKTRGDPKPKRARGAD